jgi:hypothetical protein
VPIAGKTLSGEKAMGKCIALGYSLGRHLCHSNDERMSGSSSLPDLRRRIPACTLSKLLDSTSYLLSSVKRLTLAAAQCTALEDGLIRLDGVAR